MTLVTDLLETISILHRGNLLLVNHLIHTRAQRLWSAYPILAQCFICIPPENIEIENQRFFTFSRDMEMERFTEMG